MNLKIIDFEMLRRFLLAPFQVITADPPWKYKDSANAGKRGAVHKYQLMSTEDICNLEVDGVPVRDLGAADSLLFLWTTWAHIFEAGKVITAWGYTYKTAGFVWTKTNRDGVTPAMGMGHYVRGNTEPCLLGVRGKATSLIKSRSIRQAIIAPRREHSRKPDEIYERIDQLVGDVRKIELFARHAQPGWERWGLEAP